MRDVPDPHPAFGHPLPKGEGKAIEVAAGIVTDDDGRLLLMQRLPGKHLAGLWEFPGGKLEPGETVAQALIRELGEELGIEVVAAAPLISLPWRYPEKFVRLHALRVTEWRGQPRAREGHPLCWIRLQDIDVATMPAADAPIMTALRLPPFYAISTVDEGGSGTGPTEVADDTGRSLTPSGKGGQARSGWRVREDAATDILRQLRMPAASRDEMKRVVQHALATNPALAGLVLLNHDIGLARELGVGVHLKAAQLRELEERPLPAGVWTGASCHDAEELQLAADLHADFATLSPVCATASHPGARPLGWKRFAELVADARLPVYALGGVGPDDLERACAAGAQGVAGIRAFR